MHGNMTTHADGATIHQNLDGGVAHIELDIAATHALRDFIANTSILSGGITIAARGRYPVTAGCGHPQMKKVYSLTIIRHPQGYTFAVDLDKDFFARPGGPLLGRISTKSAAKWVKGAFGE